MSQSLRIFRIASLKSDSLKLPCRSYADVLEKVRYLHECKTAAARTVLQTFESEMSSELILGARPEEGRGVVFCGECAATAASDSHPTTRDFSDIFYQIGDLAQLLGATHDILNDVDYRQPSAQALERISSLQRIARDLAETAAYGGRSSRRPAPVGAGLGSVPRFVRRKYVLRKSSIKAACCKEKWRTGWDSNPRYGSPYDGFQDRRLNPLGDPNVVHQGANSRKLSEIPSNFPKAARQV